jgi:hypothetical protein
MCEPERGMIVDELPPDDDDCDGPSLEDPSEDTPFCCVVCGKYPTSNVFFVICQGCRIRITGQVWNRDTVGM